MKKFALAAFAAIIAATSVSSIAAADSRNDDWRQRQHDDGQSRDRGRDENGRDNRDGRDRDRNDQWGRESRHNDDGRRDRWRHQGWRHDGWRDRRGYWGGPRFVVRPGYYNDTCFVKKIRDFDRYGNVYIRFVRVCD